MNNIFVVGDSTLNFYIFSQLYAKNSNTSPEDLHLLRAVVVSDDSLTHVVLKSSIRDVFDNLCNILLLKDIIFVDSEGSKRWENDG